VQQVRFLFGEPRFINQIDPTKDDKKAFRIEDDQLTHLGLYTTVITKKIK
jgi:hypothetical protein